MHTGLTVDGGRRISGSELFVQWQQGHDRRAREQLVRRYLPLARKLARRYRGSHEPLDDLEQVANVGLVKAIDRYNPERGSGFNSFAVPTILGELKRYFRDSGWSVHVPRGLQELAIKTEQAQRVLSAETGRAPTFNELAEYLEVSVEEVHDAIEAAASHHAVSLDAPSDDGEGDGGTLGDAIGGIDPRFEQVEWGTCVARASNELSERERRALALRFVEDQTQSEIAAEIGVSQMQVSRILRTALDRLSVSLASENSV